MCAKEPSIASRVPSPLNQAYGLLTHAVGFLSAAKASCFNCVRCETNLDGKACVPKREGVYCKKCYKKKKKEDKGS